MLYSPLIHDSTKVIFTFSPLSMCWVNTHGPYRWKPRVEMSFSDCKDNSRWWKISEKFVNQYGKRILQRKRAKTFEKTQINHYSTFLNEGICRWTIQSYIEKRYVKQFTHNGNYKWIDLLPRLWVHRAKASNRYAVHTYYS